MSMGSAVSSSLVWIDFRNAPTGCVTNEFATAFIDLQTCLLLSCIVVVDLIENYKELFQHQAMRFCLDPQLRTGQNYGGRLTMM